MDAKYALRLSAAAPLVFLAVPALRSRDYHLGLALIAWLSLLMLTNGGLHIAAVIAASASA